jgi:hypothetical protein
VFAKLYTRGHLRADRWYKLGRFILYGSLEDEVPFKSVRRLAEYEDYALHLLREAGVRTARPYGLVEITQGASTCWSPSSSRMRPKSARPRWTTRSSTRGWE